MTATSSLNRVIIVSLCLILLLVSSGSSLVYYQTAQSASLSPKMERTLSRPSSNMPLVNNLNQVALASAYPTDKIVETFSGSFNTATSARQADSDGFDVYAKLDLPHGFTRPVFTRMKWSLDGTNWVDGGLGFAQSTPGVFGIAYSDSTNVTILTTQLSGTFYYEITCFWIDDYDATNPMVEPYADSNKPLAFDSRLNYQKIIKQGELTVSGTADTDSVSYSSTTNPNAWVYFESNPGQVWPAILGGAGNAWLYNYTTQGELEYSITPSAINIEWTAGASFSGLARVWYRVYAEGL